MKPTVRTDAGMSLIEVTIAMAVLVLGSMSVFGAMAVANEVKNRSRSQGLAVEAIQAQIEAIQAKDFASVVNYVKSGAGTVFTVRGLQARNDGATVGRIVRESDSTTTKLHLSFTVEWLDAQAPGALTIHYWHVNRGS